MQSMEFHRITKALSDPKRFEIIEIMACVGEMCCGDITERFSVAQPTISHHLKELVNANLVADRREGQFIYYHLRREVLTEYLVEFQRRTRITLNLDHL